MSLLLWGIVVALAAPEDALEPHWREQYLQARTLEAEGATVEAARRYRLIRLTNPDFDQAVMDLGRVLAAGGMEREALDAYRSLPNDADAVEARGRLHLAREERAQALVAFEKLRMLRPSWPGWRVLAADALAPTDPERAAALLHEYLEFVNTSLDDDGMVGVTERVARSLREKRRASLELVGAREGVVEPAVELLEVLIARFRGEPTVADAVARLGDLLVEFEIDATAAELAQAADRPLEPEGVARLRESREAFAAGHLDDARRGLEALVVNHPRSAVAWAALSDVRAEQGDLAGAEQAIRAAQQLDPLDAAYLARLGELLTEAYGPRYDGEAANALARAVRRQGTDPELWVRKARAERRAGSWELAVESYRRALELDAEATWAREAREAVEGAARHRPADVRLPEAPGPAKGLPSAAWTGFHRAWAWHERGAPERALQAVQIAREAAPRFVSAVNLEAAIRTDLGQVAQARELYEQSLRLDAIQPDVLATLAELEELEGRTQAAERWWARAAELGEPGALWRTAQRQRDRRAWWAARRTLATYFARTTRDPNYEAALVLDAELTRMIQLLTGFGVFVGVAVVAVPLWWVGRQRLGGVGIDVLLARAPRSWRDVARICAAIRHEVLKHHTSVLGSVADALEDGQPQVAGWAADRLFGPGGALEQLDQYVAELVEVGRRHGVELNLRYADPVFRPLLVAVERLRAIESDLRAGRTSPHVLRELAHVLNGEVYPRLGRLVDGISVLSIDETTLRSIWAQVVEEPAFLGAVLPDLSVSMPGGGGLVVRIDPADFRDIISNLLRNAIEVSIEGRLGQIGVDVQPETDAVTGLERVVVRVLDSAPHRLTTAMIRGRYISRGLGLAVDLTSRAGGSIHVEPAEGWSKAVAVRLPRAEGSEGEG